MSATSIAALCLAVLTFVVLVIIITKWWISYVTELYPNSRPGFPGENHLRAAYNFCGSGTNYAARRRRGDRPINDLDGCCLAHDADYGSSMTTREADDRLLECIDRFEPRNTREEVDQGLAHIAIARKEELEDGHFLSQDEFR